MGVAEKINNTLSNVRAFSFEQKKSPFTYESDIDQFLDGINSFKKTLTETTSKVISIVEGLEKLTWFNNIEEDGLMTINDIISLCKDTHSTLIRQYANFIIFRENGIAKQEIKVFKHAVDDLREVTNDLESTFFFLPGMPEFTETAKKISLI